MVHPLDPFSFGDGRPKLRNRTVVAAMTNKQSRPDGVLSDEEIRWLLRRAEGGFGIVTTAAAHVESVVDVVSSSSSPMPSGRFPKSTAAGRQQSTSSRSFWASATAGRQLRTPSRARP